MTGFLIAEMDYVLFIYGFAFIVLAGTCATMRREQPRRLPWLWLGLFGLSHGFYEWMDLLALAFGDGPTFGALRAGLLAISLLCLLEFGRQGLRLGQGPSVGRWVHIPLVACAFAGGLAGLPGLNAGIRYFLALPGAGWSALALFRASSTKGGPEAALRFGAAALCGYAVVAGMVPPQASFVPASALHIDSFLALTGVPVQVVRAAMAVIISASL